MQKVKHWICYFLFALCLLKSHTEAVWENSEGYSPLRGFSVYGDYLYWRVVQDQIPYAAILPGGIEGIIDAFSQEPVVLDAAISVVEPKFKYNSGFRIGVGYEIPCSNWDFQISWARLRAHTRSNVSNSESGIIPLSFPVAAIFGVTSTSPTFADSAFSSWHFQYDVVDFEIGRNMILCGCFHVHPFVGVKVARIHQKQHIEYEGFTVGEQALEAEITKINHFRGVGPSIGLDLDWEFFRNWSLSSGISGALMYSRFSVKDQPELELNPNMIGIQLSNTKKNRIRPMVDAYVGIDWRSQGWCDSFDFNIGVLYETQYWWNQWQAFNSFESGLISGGTSPQGDLMLYGLTVHASVTF